MAIRYIGLKHRKITRLDTSEIGDLELRDPDNIWTFACGDRQGASLYALRNHGKVPALFRLSVDLDVVHIDGRDALYAAFAFCDQGDRARKQQLIAKLFGPAILPYWQMAREVTKIDIRHKVAEAAVIDRDVILGHLSNRLPIFGRFQTRFCSAFAVRLPIMPGDIALDQVCEPWGSDTEHVGLDILAER